MKIQVFSLIIGLIVVGYRIKVKYDQDKFRNLKITKKMTHKTKLIPHHIIMIILMLLLIGVLFTIKLKEDEIGFLILIGLVILSEIIDYKNVATIYYDSDSIIYRENFFKRKSIKKLSGSSVGNINITLYDGDQIKIPSTLVKAADITKRG